MTILSDKECHFEKKTRHCKGCNRDIVIPHNQIGGFWHLSGWTNKNGLKFWGGYCSACFSKLHRAKQEVQG